MKIAKLLILVLMLVLLAVSVNAYFRNQYWECTSEGEASQGDAFGRRAGEVCTSTCCKLCVSSSPFVDCLGGNAQPQCSCAAGSGNGTVDLDPPEITFLSPLNGTTYNTADILLHVETNEEVIYMKRAFDTSGLRGWCSNCDEATLTERRMAEGVHKVRVEAKDRAGNIAQKQITFIVDTKVPIIEGISPGNNAFVESGVEEFTITYTESSVQGVRLFYKKSTASSYNPVLLSGCPNGEEQSCSVSVNFDGFSQGDTILMYAEVSDVVNTAQSEVISLTVDDELAALPFLVSNPGNDSVLGSRSVDLQVESFIPGAEFEYSDDGDRFRSICRSDCEDFSKRISVRDGPQELTVRMIDPSGNHYEQMVSFFVDSRAPSVSGLEPRGGRDPIGGDPFVVEYSEEESAEEVILHYGTAAGMNSVVRTDCPTGRRVSCEFDIDLSPFDGLEVKYYAEVRDRASASASREQSGVVDTSVPVLTGAPIAPIQDERNVLFNLQVNEEVTLEYSDNGDRFSKLCSRCSSYDRERGFRDGFHHVVVRAVDDAGNSDEMAFNFTVDSSDPRIRGFDVDDATNGTLLLEYSELSPAEVVVSYRPVGATTWTNASFTDCPGSSRGVCALELNLTSFNGQEFEFLATMTDIAGNVDQMRRADEAVVDTIVPSLNVLSPVNGSAHDGRVLFLVNVSEEVTIEYSDDGGDRFRRLCSRCSSYDRERTFRDGSYDLIIRALDEAGNAAEVRRTVSVF